MIAAKAVVERHLASPRLDGFATGLMYRTGRPSRNGTRREEDTVETRQRIAPQGSPRGGPSWGR
jgi:hypothetical protein